VFIPIRSGSSKTELKPGYKQLVSTKAYKLNTFANFCYIFEIKSTAIWFRVIKSPQAAKPNNTNTNNTKLRKNRNHSAGNYAGARKGEQKARIFVDNRLKIALCIKVRQRTLKGNTESLTGWAAYTSWAAGRL